jgi:hypothetical protein
LFEAMIGCDPWKCRQRLSSGGVSIRSRHDLARLASTLLRCGV